jgi:hypothetical protein
MRRRPAFLVLVTMAALLCASTLAPAFGAPEATSAASLASRVAKALKLAKKADKTSKRALANRGPQGPVGPAGAPGSAGPSGAAGPAGAKGAKGDRGSQGVKGDAGEQGEQGTQGSQGPAGRSFTWRGPWSSGTAYSADDVVSHDGAAYVRSSRAGSGAPGNPISPWDLMAAKGAPGAPGEQGEQGEPGEPATRLWAVVSHTGTLVSSSGVVGNPTLVTLSGPVQITFNRNVSNCALSATLKHPSGTAAETDAGEILASVSSENTSAVRVYTYNSALSEESGRAFHLVVFC